MKNQKAKNRRQRQGKKCFFCEGKATPDYKEVETLRRFISEWGKIIPRSRTGVCAKHQRRLAKEVKRARYLALLPFVARL
ncbi:MAG: 30S ribosomal protein S18 [Microgenomates group bacterium]